MNKNNSLNNTPLQKIRCAIYTRKSNEEGLELEYNSLDNQYDSCKKYIESQQHEGWVLINKRYDDGGFTGGNLERPALKQLISDIENGLIDMVVVYKIDRLSRSLLDFAKLMDVFEKSKTTFVSVTQSFNTNDSMGRLILNILLSFAQFEREMTGDRIRDKVRMQKNKGMWTGGVVPLGYDINDKKLIINQEEAEVIKFIFSSFIETGSVFEVLEKANQIGYKTKTYISKNGNVKEGTNFNRGTIYKVLKNKIYTGKIENKSTNMVFDGAHDAVVSEEDFLKIQEIMDQNRVNKIYNVEDVSGCGSIDALNDSTPNDSYNNITRKYRPKKDSKMPYLLRGLMRCECCDSVFTPVFTTKKKSGIVYRYYRTNKAIKHSTNCKVGNVPAEQIENIVLNQVYGILGSPSVVSKVIEKIDSCSGESFNIPESEIIKYLQNIQIVWNELFPKEQMGIVKNIIKKIIVSDCNVKIIFNTDGIFDLLIDAGLVNNDNNSSNSNLSNNNLYNSNSSIKNNSSINTNSTLNIVKNKSSNDLEDNLNKDLLCETNIPVDFRYRAGRSFITTPAGKDISIVNADTRRVSTQNSNDTAVVIAILRAEAWKTEIEKNKINVSGIAKRENKTIPYISRVLNLVFLAPDIKKAILVGSAPLGLTLLDLYGCVDLDWSEQRKRFGNTTN